jgi:uncharacterized protein YxjI
LFRGRREERREEREATRYQMRQRMISIGDDYVIENDGDKVAEVSKRWFRVRDTYGVEVFPGENDVMILAIVAVIDTMALPDR